MWNIVLIIVNNLFPKMTQYKKISSFLKHSISTDDVQGGDTFTSTKQSTRCNRYQTD